MKIDVSEKDPIEIGATGFKRTVQQVRTVLQTIKGTVPLNRSFGMDLSFVDQPENVAMAKATANIIGEVEKQVPEVKVLSVKYKNDADSAQDGILFPIVEIKIESE